MPCRAGKTSIYKSPVLESSMNGPRAHGLTVDRVPTETADRAGLMSLHSPYVIGRGIFFILVGDALDIRVGIPAGKQAIRSASTASATQIARYSHSKLTPFISRDDQTFCFFRMDYQAIRPSGRGLDLVNVPDLAI
jgi:hypothetical protein